MWKRSKTTIYILFCILFFFFGCQSSFSSGGFNLQEVTFEELNSWEEDNHSEALEAFKLSCQATLKGFPDQILVYNLKQKELQKICKKSWGIGSDNLSAKRFFEEYFTPYAVLDSSGDDIGMFTGYYEARLQGSRNKTEKYQYPVYSLPNNRINYKKLTRKNINDGALNGLDLEILYVDDWVELYFMHVQGSGKVELEDGEVVQLLFADKNYKEYKSIGKLAIEKGFMKAEDMSAENLKKWMKNNPKQALELTQQNESYIFFQEAKLNGVIGAQGSQLMAERSLAVDKNYIVFGLPIWLETSVETDGVIENYERLMMAQDTGSAIKGTIRGDIFFGSGKRAESLASTMHEKGRYYLLLPKQ